MEWLQDALKAKGLEPRAAASTGPRAKLLTQVNRMLSELSKYKTAAELDGNTSKFWWAPQSVAGQRRVVMRYGNQIVNGSAVYVDNTLDAVCSALEAMKDIIENSKDEQWASEEERRKKK